MGSCRRFRHPRLLYSTTRPARHHVGARTFGRLTCLYMVPDSRFSQLRLARAIVGLSTPVICFARCAELALFYLQSGEMGA
jgi:hypothetical protein